MIRSHRISKFGVFGAFELALLRLSRAVSFKRLCVKMRKKAGLGIEHPILQVAVYDGVESVNKIIELP